MKTMTTVLILMLVLLPASAFADAATYDAKCKMCHGADGKKLAKADLTSQAIQAKSDAELVNFLLNDPKHKSKVANQATAQALVKYMRTLKK